MYKEKVQDKFFERHLKVHPPVVPRRGEGKRLVRIAKLHVESGQYQDQNINRIKTNNSFC
jgi:hypothetical protein